ncbi:Chromatin structure-remodeling complex protein rsc9 [Verticillium nonalfalfae]|uniref:Chromatin structure-remodeling complex protein rsc9 n=1 Tax=Verticillium nonalfalfae TaxID=1051616 RepID=A0A3M9YL06_9PEZI|nr:Chromatin structure-remodeling complex protein rsc9 [Verticillium nonalfalfae]RNJ61094.1 Chromatin structure-remodeling complex protein rsc9 [Verticillium nonalfalfae]
MAPETKYPPHEIDRTPEYEEFMTKLRAYHQQRGTTLDPEPKCSTVNLDLYKLFNLIVEEGGYDEVSDRKLAWREMVEKLGIPMTSIASTAYQLKDRYLKNLAAYEISTIHGKEPPPKDILEDGTAKGGSLLTRTRENYRKQDFAGDSAASGDDGTPSRDRPSGPETTPVGSSLRASRGLREAPPQRVIFQPDTGPTRTRNASGAQTGQTSQTTSQHHSNSQTSGQANTPGHFPSAHPTAVPMSGQQRIPRGPSGAFNPSNSENVASAVDTYQPKSLQAFQPLVLRPVDTPGNNPAEFARRRQLARQRLQPPELPHGTPGLRKDGAGIYHRCLMGLRSKILAEQEYAVHHFVKISYERGDKFKFEQFAGLADALVEKALDVGTLFYDIKWEISWVPVPNNAGPGVLDGENGTPDILDRISKLTPKPVSDLIQPAEFSDALRCISEAVLTIRNMVTLQDNAHFVSDLQPLKDLICIILGLPTHNSIVELKHMALEITECLTPYMSLGSDDPLYQVLLEQLKSTDRGMILGGLRALGRISMKLANTNKLSNVPAETLESITRWLQLNDDDLMDACLDFLYQYTAVAANIDDLLRFVSAESLVIHLVRLLSHGAKKVTREVVIVPELKTPPNDYAAPMPTDLLQELLAISEPERCQAWVKCFFEEDKDSFVTQIMAWQAYQAAFVSALKTSGQTLITPADFIRNATIVYKESRAEVLRVSNAGETQQKFIIQGLRARENPVGLDGKDPQQMSVHILTHHLGIAKNAAGTFDNVELECRCQWGECRKFPEPTNMKLFQIAHHISVHASIVFPRKTAADGDAAQAPTRDWLKPAVTKSVDYEETAMVRDERNPNAPLQAAGIPLSAALILRNIARNVPKTQAEAELLRHYEGGWNERLFRCVRPRLFELMGLNKGLAEYIASIIELVEPETDN